MNMGNNKELDPDSGREKASKAGQYMPGLDGLRAIAVLAVVLYHLNQRFAPGGLLGVGVFFVLSGYLITDLLVAEWARAGRIDIRNFWLRRARRLLPALLLMIVGVVAWVAVFNPGQITSLRSDVLASILYISNWWYIFHHVSYFASFGPPSPVGHLWSLAVEEQFYLIWPLVLIFCLRFAPRRGWLIGVALAGAWLSAFAMVWLYQPGLDPSRVYYGTDTRAFALLFGAVLAFVCPSRTLIAGIRRGGRVWFDLAGGLGLLVILVMFVDTNEYQPFLYPAGLLLISLATAGVIAAGAQRDTIIGRLLGWHPLRWLGVRSYGIYLWHYPIIVLSTPTVVTTGPNYLRAAIQVALSIALAAASWRFVERPIRTGALTRLWVRWRSHGGQTGGSKAVGWHRRIPDRWTAGTKAGLIVLSATGFGVATSVPADAVDSQPPNLMAHSGGSDSRAGTVASHTALTMSVTPSKWVASSKLEGVSQRGTNSIAAPSAGLTRPSQTQAKNPSNTRLKGKGVTAIGDSVMIDAQPYLRKDLPGIVVDGKVGRQMYELPSVLAGLKSKGELGSRVIIELGTNGPFTKGQLLSLMNALRGAQQIILVNTRVPRPWQDVVNQTLAEVSAHSKNTTLVDWYDASAGHNSYFYPDGVHLNPAGSQVFAALVTKAVQPAKTGGRWSGATVQSVNDNVIKMP